MHPRKETASILPLKGLTHEMPYTTPLLISPTLSQPYTAPNFLACLASVSVWFRNKERVRNKITQAKHFHKGMKGMHANMYM